MTYSPEAALSPLGERDTLEGMEDPGSALSGQVVPVTAEPDAPETDAPETDAPQAPSGPVWRFLISPRWLGWHLFVVCAVLGMLWLGDWQYRRAMEGNGLSWAYTFEWPMFAVFGIVFWARTIRDEFRVRRGIDLVVGFDPAMPDGVGWQQIEQPDYPAYDVEDPELASYNAYLAKLNTEYANGRKQITAG